MCTFKKASPNGRIVGNDSSLAREYLCSAPFRSFLFKINENLATDYSGRFTLIQPLLTYAAEQSASWQHWWEGEWRPQQASVTSLSLANTGETRELALSWRAGPARRPALLPQSRMAGRRPASWAKPIACPPPLSVFLLCGQRQRLMYFNFQALNLILGRL